LSLSRETTSLTKTIVKYYEIVPFKRDHLSYKDHFSIAEGKAL
jgi:hypothetical protein